MATEGQTLTWQIPQWPDPSYSQYQAAAGNGDVRAAAASGSQHLLRALAHMPAGSCCAEFLFLFEPENRGRDRQSRLGLFLRMWASDSGIGLSLDSLVRGGLLSRFYEFRRIEHPPDAARDLRISCDIVRREDLVQPLCSCDFNAKIPSWYYTINSFTPNEKNDYVTLDRVLDRIVEPVTISVRVQPGEVATELHAHTAYLARLGAINHSWDPEDEDFAGMDGIGSDGPQYVSMRNQLRPLNYRDPLAADIQQAQREFHRTLLLPHLLFSIRIMAETEAVAKLVSSVFAESAFKEGLYRIIVNEQGASRSEGIGQIPAESQMLPCRADRRLCRDATAQGYEELGRLSQLATVEELSGVFRLPVASFSSPLCCRKNTDVPPINERDLIVLGDDEQGVAGNGSPISRGILIDLLRKHFGSFGLPGTGKTTSNINVLFQVYERNIPFLVIECAKKEYRALKMFKNHQEASIRRLAEDLEIYTPGNERLSPFRLNPFAVLPGIDVLEHIENLLSCFKASIPVSAGSLPALLGEALEKVYEDRPDLRHPPVMMDLVAAVEKVLATKRYSGDTRSDMQTAIEVRLGVLAQRTIGRVFQDRHGIGIEHLMKVPSVIELDRLPAEQACLSALFLLNGIREYLKTISAPATGLSYLVLIEEAHVIFGSRNTSVASEEVADTQSFVAAFISRMLVELRAMGVGMILSDQHPSSVDPSASRSVASKLAFRQVHRQDREELGSSMLFTDREMQDIARLGPGEAFFFTEGYFEPRRIRTPDLHKRLRLTPPPTDKELLKNIEGDAWFQKAQAMRLSHALDQLKEAMDVLDRHREAIANRVKDLLAVYEILLGQKAGPRRTQQLTAMIRHLRALKARLALCDSQFRTGPYRLFSSLIEEDRALVTSDLAAYAAGLRKRYESVLQPGTQGLVGVIDRLIKNVIQLKIKEKQYDQKR
jgi:hypothetical protein